MSTSNKMKEKREDDDDDDDDDREISLSEYLHQELAKSLEGPSTSDLASHLTSPDAFLIFKGTSNNECYAQLPLIDWKVFRKAYTLLMWIRPIVRSSKIYDEENNDSTTPKQPKLLYRLSTHSQEENHGVGICCQVGDWHSVDQTGLLQTTLTVWNMADGSGPSNHHHAGHSQLVLQVPLLLQKKEWSLIGITHTYPYLKRPMWTLTVNGQVMGTGELSYPVVDIPMGASILCQNLHHGGCATILSTNEDDTKKTASELAENPPVIHHQMEFHLASVSLYPEVISPQLQALVCAGGVQLSLQSQGKILTVLPPIDNWSKGSSLEGPNVGIPLCVSGGALDLQRLSSKVYLYFGATQARYVQSSRIVVDMPYLPGETTQTPKVGLLQPGLAERPTELPKMKIRTRGNTSGSNNMDDGDVAVHHTLSAFLLGCTSTQLDTQLTDTTKEFSICLLEQGYVATLVLPFFLSQLPPAHGLGLQQSMYTKSLEYLWKLWTNDGMWAGRLVHQLADLILYQGGRAQELILQGGIIHVLSSTLRRSLLRAHLLKVHTYETLQDFLSSTSPTTEAAWHRPNHAESCPPWIPSKLITAATQLVRSCCGIHVTKDLTALLYIQRSSDLALTAVFGFALHLDLWGNSTKACCDLFRVLAHRYANLQGGHILRNQIPLQSMLDLIRTRLPENFESPLDLILILQHMLLSSLSNRKLMHLAEADISACMGALSDCPLGTLGAHLILTSLTNLLQWCSAGDGDEAKLGVVARMGRNLVVAQYHDVLAPMLLSRTVFCGERSMSGMNNTTEEKVDNKEGATTTTESTTSPSKQTMPQQQQKSSLLEEDWRLTLLLFAWISSIAGPEGLIAAKSTGSLLLASALAGSLRGCLDTLPTSASSTKFVSTLFLPPPAMALLVRNNKKEVGGAGSTGSNWTYTDLLSDRLGVMMPLVPGMVASLLWDVPHPNMNVLTAIISSVGGAFHRVFAVLTQTTTNTSPSSGISLLASRNSRNASATATTIIKAAKDYLPPLLIVASMLEHQLRQRSPSHDDDEDTSTTIHVLVPPKPQTPVEKQSSESAEMWIDATNSMNDPLDVKPMIPQDCSSEKVKTQIRLETCLVNLSRTITELIANAMRAGGKEASQIVWRSVLSTLASEEVVHVCNSDKNKSKEDGGTGTSTTTTTNATTPTQHVIVTHALTCRFVAMVLNLAHRREYEWEIWSGELCSSISCLFQLIQERKLLERIQNNNNNGDDDKKKKNESYTKDQLLLVSSMCDVLKYGREMTGWCQLVLPTPPETPGGLLLSEPPAIPRDEFHRNHSTTVEIGGSADMNNSNNSIHDGRGGEFSSSDNHSSHNNNRPSRFVRPEVPGASSKLLLPVLTPCLRMLLSNIENIKSKVQMVRPTTSPLVVQKQDESGDGEGADVGEAKKDDGDAEDVSVSFLTFVIDELRESLTAAIVGLSFPNSREMALHGLASLRRGRMYNESCNDEKARDACSALFVAVVEEIRVRYEGERRFRETALFDAYDDEDGAGGEATREIRNSNAVEQMILGSDLIPGSNAANVTSPPKINKDVATEEITFGDEAGTRNEQTGEDNTATAAVPEETTNVGGTEDFVMFPGAYDGLEEHHNAVGWNQLKGLGSALEECAILMGTKGQEEAAVRTEEEASKMVLSLLGPYIDAWDESMEKMMNNEPHSEDLMFEIVQSESDSLGQSHVQGSETAADVMSTYIEMASVEKARLTEVTALFLPSRRYSCQAYTDRYCWAKYFEIVDNDSAIGLNQLCERGMSDGNRDVRSRLVTMPCNPQFKRHLPRHLDHGQHMHEDDGVEPYIPDDSGDGEKGSTEEQHRGNRRESAMVVDGDNLDKMKSLMEAGKVEIVDITKKEIAEDELPELIPPESMAGGDDEDEMYGDGSLGFPSREDDEKSTGDKTNNTDVTEESGSTESSGQTNAAPSKASEKPLPITFHHHIASSIYSHPPDNSASILSLMQTTTARMIEKHFEGCLHVKAEGSRKCTVLLSATHLILEYDTESEGLFEGEMMAVKEEAERQRLIEEAGGDNQATDLQMVEIEKLLERRQKEIASMRPKSIRWNLSELSHVYLRRYRLRDTGLEMFFIPSGGTSYGGFGLFSPATSLFLDFGSGRDGNERRDEAAHAIMRRAPPQTIKQWPDRSGQFLHEQLSRLTMGWVEGRITNFDYLLHLNMLAGRSYNDLCQYPVMPWVLSDYTSNDVPDLSDKKSFRDLTKPMGALNPDRLEDFLERFQTFADATIPPFMYGSHYSTSAGVVLHFLVRMHPFAGLHRQLQGGHFDVADRLFSSVPRTWEMCTGYSAAEVKELTPEWYCNPAFLKNNNKFKLGTSQDNEVLGDVVLPPWAKGSAERFVEVMRNALESDVCSEMLPDWIDLIFGRKQQGPEAVKAHNVFFYLTYYGSVDVASIEDESLRQATELQIAHFGQCPMQLFVRPHVRRTIQIRHYQKMTFYQMLSAYTQGAGTADGGTPHRRLQLTKDGSQRLFGEPLFLPFFSAPESHFVHLEAPPPGPHADLVACRLAGVDRCLAVDANGIFHSFRWAWKADMSEDDEEYVRQNNKETLDRGCFIAQRELHRFRTVPRLMYCPDPGSRALPAIGISKTLFASRSVLLVLSDGDGRGGLAMQLVDPAKGSIKGEALVTGVHASRIVCIAMDPIGTAAGHGGVGGELAIVGSADGNASLWRFMSSHYLPLRPRIRMRGHGGQKIQSVALSSAIHVCMTVSANRLCLFSVGNGALVRTWGPPDDTLDLPGDMRTKTIFADTPACSLSVQGFVVTVCKTSIFDGEGRVTREVVTLHLFSLEGVSLGSKALESWRGVPRKIISTPDGTAITVCSGRGVTIHRLSAITPLEFIDEWHITESEELNDQMPAAMDADFGPSLMRPIVSACALSGGALRFHALPGISAWSERHKSRGGFSLGKPIGRLRNVFGMGKSAAKQAANVGTDVAKEVASDVKEKGVGGFLTGTLFRKKK